MTTRLERVKLLAEEGYTNAEIAAEIGVRSERQVIRLKRQAGVPPRNRENLSQEEIARIRHLSNVEEWPPGEIADTVGVSYYTVRHWAKRGPGQEWNKVARWCAAKYPHLYRELMG